MASKLSVRRVHAALAAALLSACSGQAPAPVPPAPRVQLPAGTEAAPVLTPEQAMATFQLPEGYSVELVAAEPLVQDPVDIDFDADGRMYVVEMRGYMPNVQGEGELAPLGRVVVLEDLDDDGRMDRSTVFMDSLVLPRAVTVLEQGILVGEPPNLWLARDTDGDLRADSRELVRGDYGTITANPEHNANGLLWGQDNWIHNSAYAGQFRVREGRFEFRAAQSQGQWGLSMDDFGRIFRNANEDPLRADLVPSHYTARSASMPQIRGVYERLTANVPVWPIHKTPGVNRGYRSQTLRPDSTLAHYTAAGSPTAYVGDRLPESVRGSVFISEPAGNLVGQFLLQEGANGELSARRAEERRDFMASTDERFRPVNLASAPDGTLYVVDMYRGIIQHRMFITGFLEQQIRDRGLADPIGLGRIYRIVHTSTRREAKPQLTRRSSAQLVEVLAHPNGWWRNTAQRMIVERGDRSVAPALRRLYARSDDPRFRLHALWTLEGLSQVDTVTLGRALRDESPHVRAAAIRIAESWMPAAGNPYRDGVMRLLEDSALVVRRQLAATLGELPQGERERALAMVVARYGSDPVVADLVVSGVRDRQVPFLERILAAPGTADPSTTIRALAAAVLRGRDAAAVQRVLALASTETTPRAARLALLAGLTPPGQTVSAAQQVALPSAPVELLAAIASSDTAVSARARGVATVLSWPGKPQPVREVRPLTAEEQARFAAGEQQYQMVCAGCHLPTGLGLSGVAKSLVGSSRVVGSPANLIRIVLHGKDGENLMPPVGSSMTDEQVAAVLTYVRRAWGNDALPVTSADVYEARGATLGRQRPYTDAELP